ncbi:hypothetical protein NCCP2716_00460 [Sporosarcina sp. NCCP-2716]|uniref:hypothetical protein n=1 Tax=Sporosarcina sp. NCCP-2716 TaxID=2943679 RepID=UPI0020416FBA|nr:hypothetical protein [Sporosarcina sp. NCCP-2716]GKV67548.1 hypothetical protein NCCP2716_00460 [Sporosarcina sp. NCCP-2716]
MPVTEYYVLWKVTVPSTWMAAVLGLIAGWLAVRRQFGKRSAELIGDAFFTVLIVWKLSVIVTDFPVVWRSPAAILYFNGGAPGFIAGMCVAGLLAVRSEKRLPVSFSRVILLAAACAQGVYQIMMALLNAGPAYAKVLTAVLFGTLVIAAFRYAGRHEMPVRSGALLLIAVHAFTAAVQPSGFAGIPFAATVAAGALIILTDVRLRQSGKQLEGLDE